MSVECGYCERDLRGPHDKNCPRVAAASMKLLREAVKILKANSLARTLNKDFISRASEHIKEYKP